MELTPLEKLNVILDRENITKKELAERLGTSRQNLNNKLNRNNLSTSDLEKIAEAINYKIIIDFVKK